MSIRLNKVLTELNIGLQTAVDFLKNNKNLGEIKEDANLSTKISDEQYAALKSNFQGDKAVKNEAEKIFAKKTKEKKVEKKVVKAEELLEQRQQFKPMGKIDLDNVGKKVAPSVAPEKPEPKAAAESPVEVKEEIKKEEVKKPVEEKKPEVKAQPEVKVEKPVVEEKPKKVEAPVAPKAEPKVEKPVQAEPQEASEEPKIFTLKSEAKMAPKVNVLGKIDLDSLNQSTRPKKKSKEERKKEREEKAAQMHGGERKKRVRIGKERVDIEAASNQQGGGKKNKNKGANNNNNNNNQGGQRHDNNQQQGGGKKNKKNRQQPKPLEVNEEDVARQVKETLARLTAKNQNKKGAKYRREKRDAVQERLNEELQEQAAESKVLKLTEFVTVSELATMMDVPVTKVIGTCMSVGIMVSINQRLDAETINIVADELGFKTEYVSAEVSEAI